MKVLITRKIPQVGIHLLSQYPEIEIDYREESPLSDKELKKSIKGVDAIIPVIPDQITKEVIKAAGPKLRLIATYSVGYDNVDVEAATKARVFVANTPGDLTESVAEHAFALMMTLARRISEGDRYCRAGKYKYWDPLLMIGSKLSEKTIGIVGFGRIGQQLGRMAKYGLNMKVLYSDVVRHPEAESLIDAKKVELDQLLSESDVVSINCNLCDQTHHLIDDKQLHLMKPLSYIINTARGPIIDEKALVTALKEGIIAGAGLDVFEEEPKIHPELLDMENVVLTPHIGSATLEARIQMARMAAENVIDVLINNKQPRYLVNKDLAEDSIKSIV